MKQTDSVQSTSSELEKAPLLPTRADLGAVALLIFPAGNHVAGEDRRICNSKAP